MTDLTVGHSEGAFLPGIYIKKDGEDIRRAEVDHLKSMIDHDDRTALAQIDGICRSMKKKTPAIRKILALTTEALNK